MTYTIEHRLEHLTCAGNLCVEAWFVRQDGKRVTVAYPSEAHAERARGVLCSDDQRLAREKARERKAAVRVVV